MDIIIRDISEDHEPTAILKLLLTLGDVTSLVVGYKVHVGTIEEQNEKPLYVQAAVICGHIHNKDYGLAESKARILRGRLQKGDWTLGAGTETDRADDGFVRMQCDVIDNMGKSAQRKEDSEMLMKVVEIVKNWDARKSEGYPTPYKLVDLLVDYIEAPEARAE